MVDIQMGDVTSIFEAIEDGRMSCESFLKRCQGFYALGKSHGPDWLPIADAPRDGTPVLLYVAGQQTEAIYFPLELSQDHEGFDTSTGAVWSCADDEWQIEVEEYTGENGQRCYREGPATHYMPLPKPPEPKP